MVCKEDVLLWFKDLDSYKRIDVMYELLSMCLPFEVRILGSCIEEIGKTSFQELRGSALYANDLEKLNKDVSLTRGLIEEGVRHRVIIYLSLLSGSNWKCANWFYKTLLRTEWVESCVLRRNIKDDNLLSELLLLFTIGMRHPAFSFEQKMFFSDLMEELIKQKDSRQCVLSNNLFCNYPPPSGYANLTISKDPFEVHMATVKPSSSNEMDGQFQHHENYVTANGRFEMNPISWNRPGFVGTVSGAPEVAPFPPPPASPLLSRSGSPTRSHVTSPHKMHASRSLFQHTSLVDMASGAPQDLFPTSRIPYLSEAKSKDEDLNHIADDKYQDASGFVFTNVQKDVKPLNGIRLPVYNKVPPQQYILEQIHALNLEGANSLHCSSSCSSSDNSSNQSPPDTPSATPAVPHHGPGRGESKSRANGVTQFVNLGPSICETTTPPSLHSCSVPYTTYPTPVALAPVPSNSTPQVPPRNAHCFNCGATGHNGSDCNGQTIEDITQKKAFMLDYNSILPDADK